MKISKSFSRGMALAMGFKTPLRKAAIKNAKAKYVQDSWTAVGESMNWSVASSQSQKNQELNVPGNASK